MLIQSLILKYFVLKGSWLAKECTAVHEEKGELCWYHGTFYYGVQDYLAPVPAVGMIVTSLVGSLVRPLIMIS
jgi:hypothetical protein